jgi:hypothetical protein
MILHFVSFLLAFFAFSGGTFRNIVPVCPYANRGISVRKRCERRVNPLCEESVLLQIEELRRELNERYKKVSAITPELLELSVKLDGLLNKLYLHP